MQGERPEEARRLDGNVAAGILAEVFCVEMSTALSICAGCGAKEPVAVLMAYGLEMGAILRCPHCDNPVLRIGVTGTVRWVDTRGAAGLRFEIAG